MQNRRLKVTAQILGPLILLVVPSDTFAASCLAPVRPFVPADSRSIRDYEGIIRQDFEIYIQNIQGYFQCLDQERARAFEEASQVSQDYRRFLELVGD